MTVISLNGTLVEPQAAVVSVDERGFRFGDGVFETIPVHGGAPYLWEYHMERLEAGLSALSIRYSVHNLMTQTTELLRTNKVSEGMVRIYISRGIGSRGYLPSPAPHPTTVIQTLERQKPPAEPVTLWLSAYEKISPRALPTHCKLAQGVGSTLARMEAEAHGCYEALQLSAEGHIAEASSANIFWLAAGKLYTPSLACGALAGVTRRRIMELSPYPVQEGAYTLDALKVAEAVILTNAVLGIVPVKVLQPLSIEWKSDALTQQLITLRNQDITQHAHNNANNNQQGVVTSAIPAIIY